MRLIATDLDGTLLGPRGELSDRNAKALHLAREAGWYVVLATGRPPFMLADHLPRLQHAVTHGVLANGSLVCTLPDLQTLRSTTFGVSMATDVVATLRVLDPGFGFALATDGGFAHEPGFAERMPSPQPVPPTSDVLDAARGATEVIKLMVFHEQHSAHRLLDVLPPILGADLAVTHMGADCVEVGPSGIDKGSGLTWLCAHLGVDAADVVAFGDEFNDHEMLSWAGLGVAMANAHPLTRELADEVTSANHEDGVAVVIERLVAGR